jgi:hypothetical protein
MARQSDKVTLFGTNSGGVLDYGNVRATQMPGATLVLHRPITRTRRLPPSRSTTSAFHPPS